MKRALLALLLVAGGALAYAGDETDYRALERDVASVETSVRAAAFEKAEKVKNSAQKIRLLCKAAEDADPAIQKRARERLLKLDARDARHLRPDRLAGPLLRATSEEDQLQLLQIIEAGLDSGARFPPGPLFAIALKAKDKTLRERVLKAAAVAVDVAPIVSTDTPSVLRLLHNPETREAAIDIVCRSEGHASTALLLQLESQAGGVDPESEKVKAALDGRAALEDFFPLLEELAKSSPDERVRAAAKKRLAAR